MEIKEIDVSWTNDTNPAPKPRTQALRKKLQKILTNKWLLIAGVVIYWLSDTIENDLLCYLAFLLYLPSIGYLCFNLFSSKKIPNNLKKIKNKKSVYLTKEGLFMTLVSKKYFLTLASKLGLVLQGKVTEYERVVSTGKRMVMRGILQKTS